MCTLLRMLSCTLNTFLILHGDQLYMAVRFRYLVKRDSSSVLYCIIAFTSVTFNKEPVKHDHE